MKCVRCNSEFGTRHILDCVCPACLQKNPKFSAKEKSQMNLWDKWSDFADVMDKAIKGEWCWAANSHCKYVDLRIDMRDGGCIISVRGERITPERLAWQYSKETPEPPS